VFFGRVKSAFLSGAAGPAEPGEGEAEGEGLAIEI
jgi:hypothetical protein